MRVLFYGSLDSEDPEYDRVRANVGSLIDLLIKKNAKFTCRAVVCQPEPAVIPIDNVVLERIGDVVNVGSVRVTVFHEPESHAAPSLPFEVKNYTASSAERTTFYRELLTLTDIVIGVGGQRGLIRMEMSCQLYEVPILVLPGTGGAADVLWSEMFSRSPQFLHLNLSAQNRIRSLPYADGSEAAYAKRCAHAVEAFVGGFRPSGVPNATSSVIGFQSIGISELVSGIKRLSLTAWGTAIGLVLSLTGVAYGLGYSRVFDKIGEALERLLAP